VADPDLELRVVGGGDGVRLLCWLFLILQLFCFMQNNKGGGGGREFFILSFTLYNVPLPALHPK